MFNLVIRRFLSTERVVSELPLWRGYLYSVLLVTDEKKNRISNPSVRHSVTKVQFDWNVYC